MLGYVIHPHWKTTRTNKSSIQVVSFKNPSKYVEIVEMNSENVSVSIPLEIGSFTLTFSNTKQAYEYLENFLLDPPDFTHSEVKKSHDITSKKRQLDTIQGTSTKKRAKPA